MGNARGIYEAYRSAEREGSAGGTTGEERQPPSVCSVCGKPAVAYTLVSIADGGGRIMLCRRHELEADRAFAALLRKMVANGARVRAFAARTRDPAAKGGSS